MDKTSKEVVADFPKNAFNGAGISDEKYVEIFEIRPLFCKSINCI